MSKKILKFPLNMTDCEDIFSIPKDVMFPDELNRYLRDQITAYSHENGMFQKHLRESEEKCVQMQKEIDILKKYSKSDEAPVIPQFRDSSKTINTKIVELSKKLREKCAETEKYKTKYSKLLMHIEELKKQENEEKSLDIKSLENKSKEHVKSANETQGEIKQLQEKISVTTNRMLDIKNTNIQLRNELKQANKLLQRETGEDINALQGNSTWKGRAQIICDLQEKNKKLKEKLRNIQEFGEQYEIQIQNEKLVAKIATLEKEKAELKSNNETYKAKIDTLKSRCNMLETAQQELKLKTAQVQERSTKELEIIASMSNQLAEAENKRRQAMKEKDNEINKLKVETKNLQDKVDDYKALTNNLRVKMNEQNSKTDGNDMSEQVSKQRQETLQKTISNLEEEKLKLLDVIDVQKRRLDNERKEHDKFQQLYRLEKQRAIKFETAIVKSDLEAGCTHRSSYSVISQSSKATEQNLRDQLQLAEENIKALKTRLQLEQHEKSEDLQEFSKILKVSSKKFN